jgi:hypothetical protein
MLTKALTTANHLEDKLLFYRMILTCDTCHRETVIFHVL